MSYTKHDWTERLRNRSDMSGYLYHLTRKTDEMNATDILIKILNERKIVGSTTQSGFIVGSEKAVCFQDTTPYGLSQNTFHEQKLFENKKATKMRYNPIGLAFEKKYVYDNGGRPVFYEETETAKQILPEDEWWRIVNFDLSNSDKIIDWTHEREWRIKGDFEFELMDVCVILTHKGTYKNFINKAGIEIINQLAGIVVLDPVLT